MPISLQRLGKRKAVPGCLPSVHKTKQLLLELLERDVLRENSRMGAKCDSGQGPLQSLRSVCSEGVRLWGSRGRREARKSPLIQRAVGDRVCFLLFGNFQESTETAEPLAAGPAGGSEVASFSPPQPGAAPPAPPPGTRRAEAVGGAGPAGPLLPTR